MSSRANLRRRTTDCYTAAKTDNRETMSNKDDNKRAQILKVAIDFALAGNWAKVSLLDIARASDIKLLEIRDIFPTKSAILAAYFGDIDRRVLSQDYGFEPEDTPRDRLFEVIMSRFDALVPHRSVVDALSRQLPADPIGALCLVPTAMTTMTWILEAAGISASGAFGMLRAKGLLAVWLATAHIWLKDESPDLGPTMAALDRNLRRAERLAMQIDRFERAGENSSRRSDSGITASGES